MERSAGWPLPFKSLSHGHCAQYRRSHCGGLYVIELLERRDFVLALVEKVPHLTLQQAQGHAVRLGRRRIARHRMALPQAPPTSLGHLIQVSVKSATSLASY